LPGSTTPLARYADLVPGSILQLRSCRTTAVLVCSCQVTYALWNLPRPVFSGSWALRFRF